MSTDDGFHFLPMELDNFKIDGFDGDPPGIGVVVSSKDLAEGPLSKHIRLID